MDGRYDDKKRSILAMILIILVFTISFSFLLKNYDSSAIKSVYHGHCNMHHNAWSIYKGINQQLASLTVFNMQFTAERRQSADRNLFT